MIKLKWFLRILIVNYTNLWLFLIILRSSIVDGLIVVCSDIVLILCTRCLLLELEPPAADTSKPAETKAPINWWNNFFFLISVKSHKKKNLPVDIEWRGGGLVLEDVGEGLFLGTFFWKKKRGCKFFYLDFEFKYILTLLVDGLASR